MKLTNRQKNALTDYGEKWLYWIRRSPMLLGHETDGQREAIREASQLAHEDAIAVEAICAALGCWSDVGIYGNRYRMEIYSNRGSELLLSVDELIDW